MWSAYSKGDRYSCRLRRYSRQSEGLSTVSEHESGWRVEYAYPSELYAVDEEEAIVLSAYGVPIVLSEEISDKKVKRHAAESAC